ncbi:AbfB domain-containing protein [Streptomyces sp. NPDC020298]|uniref:AbfB domain-containing protein n=1 Tax=unclassified Streptomyces TaxID=2593676 RepID=UPI0033D2CCB3
MQDTTPQPPRNEPWENGWAPDTSRTPGTRRLWLAGGLATATIVACVTAIAVNHNAPDRSSPQAKSATSTEGGPGLLSFASPSASTKAAPGTKSLPSSAKATATASTSPDGGKEGPKASAKPSKSSGSSGSSGKGSDGTGSGGSGSGGNSSDGGGSHGGSHGSETSSAWKSVRAVNYPDRYWHVSGGYVKLDPIGSGYARRDATFKVVNGLANSSCYSFATADGGYLRHRNFVLRSERYDGSSLFKQDATFCPRASMYSGAVMLESVNYPGRFLRHQNFLLKLDSYQNSNQYWQDSAFKLVDGLA